MKLWRTAIHVSRILLLMLGLYVTLVVPAHSESLDSVTLGGGTNGNEKPLKIIVYKNGDIAPYLWQPTVVENGNYSYYRYINQYFGDTDFGLKLSFSINEVLYKYSTPYNHFSHQTIETLLSDGNLIVIDANTVVIQWTLAQGIKLSFKIHYPENARYFEKTWIIENATESSSNTSISDLKIIYGGDTFFGGDDMAQSFYNAGLNMVYLKNSNVNLTGIMGFSGNVISPASRYFSGLYYLGNSLARIGQLDNTSDAVYQDAGYHLQWDRSAALLPGEYWEVKATEQWTPPGGAQIIAPPSKIVKPGNQVTYQFLTQNFEQITIVGDTQIDNDTFQFIASSAIDNTPTITGGSIRSLNRRGGTDIVEVTVDIPPNTSASSDVLTLTMIKTGTDSSISQSASVTSYIQYPQLRGIRSNTGDMSPSFLPEVLDYQIIVNDVLNQINEIKLTPVAYDDEVITINGATVTSGEQSEPIAIQVGNTSITINVARPDGGTIRTYTIDVWRKAPGFTNITSSKGQFTPAFNNETMSYNIKVSSETDRIQFTPTMTDFDPNATIHIAVNGQVQTVVSGTASTEIPLVQGVTQLITVTYSSVKIPNPRIYSINVVRQAPLFTLSQGTLSPLFDKEITTYTVNLDDVLNTISSITIKPNMYQGEVMKINGEIVSSGSDSPPIYLNSGVNSITIEVTYAPGTLPTTYQVNINRNMSGLTAIELSRYPLTTHVDPLVTSYHTTVSAITETIQITPTMGRVDPSATISLTANGQTQTIMSGTISTEIPLARGVNNPITLTYVSVINQITLTYTVNVTREKELFQLYVNGAMRAYSPVFDTSIRTYTVNLVDMNSNQNEIIIIPKLQENDILKINNSRVDAPTSNQVLPIQFGTNTIKLDVKTRGSTSFETYTIMLNRTIPGLSQIELNTDQVLLDMEPNQLNYTGQVSSATASIRITPTMSNHDANATITIVVNEQPQVVISGAQSTEIPLTKGIDNIIKLIYSSEELEFSRIYELTIFREEDLFQLSEGSLDREFDPSMYQYEAIINDNLNNKTSTTFSFNVYHGERVSVNNQLVANGTSQPIPLQVGDNRVTIIVTSSDEAISKTYAVTVRRSIPSLTSIGLSTGQLDRIFDPLQFVYHIQVASAADTIMLSPIMSSNDPQATIEIKVNGGQSQYVASGELSTSIAIAANIANLITIEYRSPNLKVNRLYKINAIRKVKDISVNRGTLTPSFDPSIFQYEVKLIDRELNMNDIQVTSSVYVSESIQVNGETVSNGGSSRKIPLNPGENLIQVLIRNELNNSQNIYKIKVYREIPGLMGIILSEKRINPDFSPFKDTYDAVIPNSSENIKVKPVMSSHDTTATITLLANGQTQILQSGQASNPINILRDVNNPITISYISEELGINRVYTINVKRQPIFLIDPGNETNLDFSSVSNSSSGTTQMGYANIKTDIKRVNLSDGTIVNQVDLSASEALAAINQLSKYTDKTLQLQVKDPSNEVSQIRISLAKGTLDAISDSGAGLSIISNRVCERIPNYSFKDLPEEISMSIDSKKEQMISQEKKNEIQTNVSNILREKIEISKMYQPISIVTNLQDREVLLDIIVDPSVIPSNPIARQSFINNIAVYVQHSDGEVSLEKGQLLQTDCGLNYRVYTKKFSTFNLLSMTNAQIGNTAYISGYPDGTFKPGVIITRSEIAMIISRLSEKDVIVKDTSYKDVSTSHWAYEAIREVSVQGIMSQYTPSQFLPDRGMTRGEMADILVKWFDLNTTGPSNLLDISKHQYQSSIEKVVKAGYMRGDPGGTFRPDDTINRVETVVMLNRVLGNIPSQPPKSSYFSDIDSTYWGSGDIQIATKKR